MQRKMRTVPNTKLGLTIFLMLVLVGLAGPSLYGQEIHIRVLSARNGKPITNECLNV